MWGAWLPGCQLRKLVDFLDRLFLCWHQVVKHVKSLYNFYRKHYSRGSFAFFRVFFVRGPRSFIKDNLKGDPYASRVFIYIAIETKNSEDVEMILLKDSFTYSSDLHPSKSPTTTCIKISDRRPVKPTATPVFFSRHYMH
ncbi:unnamed protein product [Linum tenue]|uniref:Uncharacterized protein n=1 Tax=Linum tenue TaxID=586396 RepID=A0AAV0NLJ8_9ROSI|nr:unnamed protein product [Linum tenue]